MSMNLLDDQQLVELYQNGDHKAFEVLLLRHKAKIYRSIYLKVKSSELADDLFQEAFVKIINTLKLGNYNEEGKFLPWAMRIAHNLVIDHFRRTKKHKFISESSSKSDDYNIFSILKDEELNTIQKISKEELEGQIIAIIDLLPKSQKEIVHMRIFQDLSFKEIAESENISINTALGRMRYAVINMKKIIEKQGIVVDVA
ncbi:MAG: sigma-70 family RNA polymerase sigma factor [Flavobacteriia bacterium]|nr:sigma-70 family RNA polymerase sigma factor [Flavobacteriia bacterium]OJX37676.1 MAG: RNA polymerase subunit sigma-24 [Flavobacteriia bacterium 40-80]